VNFTQRVHAAQPRRRAHAWVGVVSSHVCEQRACSGGVCVVLLWPAAAVQQRLAHGAWSVRRRSVCVHQPEPRASDTGIFLLSVRPSICLCLLHASPSVGPAVACVQAVYVHRPVTLLSVSCACEHLSPVPPVSLQQQRRRRRAARPSRHH
jgi:hypothetical protein